MKKRERSGVALTAGAAAELVVDAPALVLVRADHIEAAQFDDAVAEADVGPAARHVRRDRHGAALACPRDDRRLALVVAGVEDLVGHVRQQRTETLGIRDAGGADQHRLAGRVRPADLGHHGLFLLRPSSGRRRPDDRRGSSGGWSGSSRPGGRRRGGTPAIAWRRCRSCRIPSGTTRPGAGA